MYIFKIKNVLLIGISVLFCSHYVATAEVISADMQNKYAATVKMILNEAIKDSSSWNKMAFMCDSYGPRLSGSDNLTKAIIWIEEQMKKDGLTNVHKEEVMVPHWVRGSEKCSMISPRYQELPVLAMGGSIGTPKEGITAPVYVVNSFEDLEKNKEDARNKIVLFNVPFKNYGFNVQYRFAGAMKAAAAGAVASLIRSVSPVGFNNPHTGMMGEYPDTLPKIPHAAISAEDADMIDRMYHRGQKPIVKLYLEAQTLDDVMSYNVMGEIKGSEKPEEIIAIGGHIDSWDVGTGAHDDAGGCIATWQAVKLLNDLGIRPKRTIRAVMWVNEENGVRGGKAYFEAHKSEKHALMFEFDSGVFPPEAIGYTGPDSLFEYIKTAEPLLRMIGDIEVKKGGGGVDIGPMMRNGVNGMSLNTKDEGKYFWYHHSPIDTPDKISSDDLNRCVAAIAAVIYLYSELP